MQNPNFTNAQSDAINHHGGHCCVAAVAGSGKTTVLTHRVRALVDDHDISSSRILLITFTKAAAQSMKHKLDRLLPGHKCHVATFHSFCYRWLRQFHPKWKDAKVILDPEFEKWKSDKWAADTVKELRLGYKLKPMDVKNLVDRAKSRGVHPERISETAEGVLNPQQQLVFKTYTKFARAEKRFELADIQVYFWGLLDSEPDTRDYIRSCYDEIMVDEFQDTDITQDRILRMIVGPETNLMVVGDDDQSIYSFRHTTPELIIKFGDNWNAKVINMEDNFRSQSQILTAANSLIHHNDVRMPKSLRPVIGDEGTVEVLVNEPTSLTVLNKIRELRSEGFAWGDIAILYRTNAESGIFESVFTDHDIPYVCMSQREGFFGIPEVKTLISYLRMFQHPDNLHALRFVWNRPKRFLRNDILKDAQEASIDSDIPSVLAASINRNPRLADRLHQLERLVAQGIDMVTEDRDADSILMWLVEKLNYPAWLKELAETTNRPAEDLEQIISRLHEDAAGRGNLKRFLSHVDRVIENSRKEERGDAVRLLTLHKSKGLEFPVVFFSDMVKDMVPHTRGDVTEERRLAYVGVTRAMRKLYICTSRSKPSIFIEEMGLTIPDPEMDEGEGMTDAEAMTNLTSENHDASD